MDVQLSVPGVLGDHLTDPFGVGDPGFPANTCPEDNCPDGDDNIDTDRDGVPDDCGACCFAEGCSQVPETACQAGAVYHGNGTNGNDVECAAIPTVSEWGLVVMSLLVLNRRRARLHTAAWGSMSVSVSNGKSRPTGRPSTSLSTDSTA